MNKTKLNLKCESPMDFLTFKWQTKSEISSSFLCYRWIFAFFYIFSVFISVKVRVEKNHFKYHLIFMSNWSLVTTLLRMVFGALLTSYYYCAVKTPACMNKMLKAYWVLILISNVYAFLVSFMFWGIQNEDFDKSFDLKNILVHGTNSAALLIELDVVRHSCRFLHFLHTVPFGVAYVIFTYIYFLCGGHDE